MYYFGARYYDPRTSVWQSADPILGAYLDGKRNDGVHAPVHLAMYTYVRNNPLIMIDPDGRRDVYIGGASDKDSTRIVQNYAAAQQKLSPERDIQFLSYSEKEKITAAINAPLKEGEPLNVIGHSLGAREAINQANSTEAKITNLVTIDPVGSAGNGNKPSSVGTWTDVTAAPSDRNFSDTVASVGRAFLGTTATSGADSSQKLTTSHGNFSTMMSNSGSQQKVDNSYQMPKDDQ